VPVRGSNAWWSKALAAFKEYIEFSAIDGDPSLAADDGEEESE
jgi:hypothetical protein